MLKIAHLSDLHYSNGDALAEVERCMAFAVDEVIHRGVQCVVISGDATDHALDIHAPAVDALARRIRQLADHCPVLMLQGTFSHEPPGTLNVFRLLGGRYAVHVADRIQQVALLADGRWQASAGWRFDAVPDNAVGLFSCVPTVNKAAVAAAVGATRAAEAVGEHMTALLHGFAPGNAQARAGGVPTVLISHGTVTGSTSEHGVPMVGLDHEFTTGSLFDAGASATMLGHIHLHQAWTDGERRIAYAGSLARLHYGEMGDKGFLLWSVNPQGATFEQVRTPARRTIDVSFDGAPDLGALAQRAADGEFAGASVRVTWTVNAEDRHAVDRAAIQRILATAIDIKLVGRVIPLTRTRAEGLTSAVSLAEKVGIWAATTGCEATALHACLEALVSATPEEIAARILDGDAEADPASAADQGSQPMGAAGAATGHDDSFGLAWCDA